ncbi:MAG TPA: sulfur transferase domain-containing protein [Gemmatimonadales bacterium]|nr:sulfur transferase domain-containing protein [Gemmatimonadales bacterium]
MTTPVQALAGIPNACQLLPKVVTGGQPTAANLAAFKAAGGQVVLDLRDPMEPRPLDEAAQARELGLEYVVAPVTPGTMTDETLGRILRVLREAGERTVFVHCGSGNRVGGALLAFLVLDQEFEEDDAVNQAMRMGLRSAELMEWGLDYARRHRAG